MFAEINDTWEDKKEFFLSEFQKFASIERTKDQLFPMNEKIVFCVQLALEDHYQGLEAFYFDIFQKADNFDCICFVARRSLMLSEIFYAIWIYKQKLSLAQESELKIRNKFCSDSAFITMAGTWGGFAGKVDLPTVLIVDELIMQGNSVNSILTEAERSLQKNHEYHGGELAFSALQQELVRCVSVRIYCGSVKSFTFHPNYQQKLLIETSATEAEWHTFSLRIARLCQDLPIINAAFTIGVRLEPWMNERLNYPVPQFQSCTLQHSELNERVFFYENDLGILGSVRAIYHKATKDVTLVPLFMLPDCPKDIFSEIAEEIYEKWFGTTEGRIFFPQHSRNYYEGVMLFLNCSLLQLFSNKAFEIDFKNFTLESFKLRANFAIRMDSQWNSMLEKLENPEILLKESELTRYIQRISQNKLDNCEEFSKTHENESSQVLHHLENEVYHKKILEMQYYHKVQQGFYRTQKTTRTRRNFQIEEILGENPQQFKKNKVFRSWILQFMDRGILTMKIREEKDMVCQLLRTGEASVFLFPRRYQNFIPNLLYYERHSMGDTDLFIQHLLEFQEEMSDIRKGLGQELYAFYQYLTLSNQSLSAWDINFHLDLNYTTT